ncbi:HAD family hydrolase [Wenjunlia tyrosinilytica]|uniref:HAD family hydrolase n=1 Tax=Wenjunlia tyrosinilytica TaxID=1544741 RepID=UPI00166914F8|nr:HAD family hydrolase [Wenjunlia tyrosinilytica]
MIRAVVFDVGETLVDETEVFGSWADWLGVPRHTFSAVFGASLTREVDHFDVFRTFKPDFDIEVEARKRAVAGVAEGFGVADLYPDVRPCVEALKAAGLWVGIAGNQPKRARGNLESLRLPVDLIGVSAEWGVSKPDPAFFERVLEEVPFPAGEILYVGDRMENDVVPAKALGMRAAWLRRGPWGFLARENGDHRLPDVRLGGLDELPEWVARANGEG